ncbi:hypothetical protein AC578_8059 [Pseudocercospora eumusae]|uniref:Uncharacterized protein n=1 Tax=Pseudocercospora eumusae TaxID=321146 RepID=A0A139H7R3_9PEZI|nr:hypothetical protein AC578_8059 [Pseudocercospora eumusae]
MHRDAATSVFMIPELAELILLQLGSLDHRTWKQLFVVQRVNTTFQSLIRTSPDLRRCMHLEQPDARRTTTSGFSDATDKYRKFFFSLEDIFYPFWSHVRPIKNPQTIVLGMNVSMFWSEDINGGNRVPGTLDGTTPIEQYESWRKILVPHHPEHNVELHCCGYDVMIPFSHTSTLGEIADEAVKAGRVHLGGMSRALYYGQRDEGDSGLR